MLFSHTAPLLQVRATSRANELERLGQDIQDAVIDLWHHPRVAQATLHTTHQPVALHLQVLIDIPMLKPKRQSDMQAALDALCAWLKANGVTYEIGYQPLPSPTQDAAHEKPPRTHQLMLSAKLHPSAHRFKAVP